MAYFAYKARNSGGELVQGVLEGADSNAAATPAPIPMKAICNIFKLSRLPAVRGGSRSAPTIDPVCGTLGDERPAGGAPPGRFRHQRIT